MLDCGATCSTGSLSASDEIQRQRLEAGEPGQPRVASSTKTFRFADGSGDAASNCVRQPVTAGVLAGRPFDCHLIDKKGNTVAPLYPISEMKKNKMVADFETDSILLKEEGKWHKLPTTDKGLMLIPLTEEAVARTCEPGQSSSSWDADTVNKVDE